MNNSRKLVSLLLVLVLALPMVFVAANAVAEVVDVVKTSGGRLNVWPQPVKKAGSSTQSLKNGTVISLSGDKTYSTADKRWMVFITAPVRGWVDKAYVGKKTVVPPKPVELKSIWEEGKLQGTAPNSIINLWDDYGSTRKIEMKQLPLGYVFENVWNYNNGWSLVDFVTADMKVKTGWVQTKYLVNLDVLDPTL